MPGKDIKSNIYPLILCGGGGKRLWPRSRLKSPKQFIKLFGPKTIFEQTVERLLALVPPQNIFCVTNFDYCDKVRAQAPKVPKENIITEPEAKNTAMAVGLGAIYVKQRDPNGVVIVLPSDHFVGNTQRFCQALALGAKAAFGDDVLVTVGIKPTFPHTGFGYIKMGRLGKKLNSQPVFQVESFIEKPDLVTARKFLQAGKYLWNAGIYIFQVKSLFKAFALYSPQHSRLLKTIEDSLGRKGAEAVLKRAYSQAEETSIDYAVAEKAKNMLVVKGDFDWSDIGDWKVVYDISKKDKNGNVVIFEKGKPSFAGIDTQNCLVHLADRLVATIGIKDLIIVDTPDALLIAQKDRAQEVKNLVNELGEAKKTEYL